MQYKNNTIETKKYLKTIEKYLKEQYGEVKDEWYGVMQLLADNFDLYNKCKQSVIDNGIYDAETGKKNPLLTTIKDLQATILKEVQHLGISPYAANKIKVEAEDNSDDFIDNLTKE